MTAAQARKIIHKWQQELALGQWTIVPLMRPGGEIGDGDWGRITYNWQRLEAVIELPRERSDAETEQTICHELLHLVVREYAEIARTALVGLPRATRASLQALLNDAEERICHRVARGLSGVQPTVLANPERYVTEGEGIVADGQ